jgi:hypothetical protein
MKPYLTFLVFSFILTNCSQDNTYNNYPIIEISKINDKINSIELKSNILYKVIIPNNHTMFFKHRANDIDCFTVLLNNYTNGFRIISLDYFCNDKTYTEWCGGTRHGFLIPFISKIERKFNCYNPNNKIDYYYFSIIKHVWRNTNYGYDIIIPKK